jgi:hypothetical protein
MSAPVTERRARIERRRSVFRALWHGNFKRRRVAPRRSFEHHAVVTDWFHPQWLGVGILILLLSAFDAVLTLTLIGHGAYEVNPFMESLLRGTGQSFALVKIGLTAFGVVLLTILARLRVFGRTIGYILYVVLAAYVVLVGYELFLLRNIPID